MSASVVEGKDQRREGTRRHQGPDGGGLMGSEGVKNRWRDKGPVG